MASSSLNRQPYELLETNNGFAFLTEAGQPYAIYFTDGSGYFPECSFSEHVFTFGFTPLIKTSDPITEFLPFKINREKGDVIDFDDRVSSTVANTIKLFFQDNRSILIYVCDEENGRHFARNKLFNIWFKTFADSKILKKQFVNDNNICSTILYKADNPFAKELEESLPEAIMKIKLMLN